WDMKKINGNKSIRMLFLLYAVIFNNISKFWRLMYCRQMGLSAAVLPYHQHFHRLGYCFQLQPFLGKCFLKRSGVMRLFQRKGKVYRVAYPRFINQYGELLTVYITKHYTGCA